MSQDVLSEAIPREPGARSVTVGVGVLLLLSGAATLLHETVWYALKNEKKK